MKRRRQGPSKLSVFFGAIGGFFKSFGEAVAKGDIFVKLSLLWLGAGYVGRKQFIKGLLVTLIQVLVIFYSIEFGWEYVSKFGTLGTVQQESVFNIVTMKNEFNDYDNSFLILLISLITIVIWVASFFGYLANTITVYNLQKRKEAGKHINTFKEDIA